MNMRAVVLTAALALCLGGMADAQVLEPGTRIRLSRPDAERLIGTFDRIEHDTLWVRWGSRAELPVRLYDIQRFDVWRGGTTWRWARRAIALGFVAGTVTCMFDDCQEGTESRISAMAAGGVWLGAGFGILGAIGGALLGGEGWLSIPIPAAEPASR